MNQITKLPDDADYTMTDDLARRTNALANDCNDTDGWQCAAPDLRHDAARILKLEGQREVDAGLMVGMKAVIKQFEERLQSANLSIAVLQGNAIEAHDTGFNEAIEATAKYCEDSGFSYAQHDIRQLRKP